MGWTGYVSHSHQCILSTTGEGLRGKGIPDGDCQKCKLHVCAQIVIKTEQPGCVYSVLINWSVCLWFMWDMTLWKTPFWIAGAGGKLTASRALATHCNLPIKLFIQKTSRFSDSFSHLFQLFPFFIIISIFSIHFPFFLF